MRGETVGESLEQLELVAVACHWDEPTKLVNLVTRLCLCILPFVRHRYKKPVLNFSGRPAEEIYSCTDSSYSK
jgi:hypothetical protein